MIMLREVAAWAVCSSAPAFCRYESVTATQPRPAGVAIAISEAATWASMVLTQGS